jgi:hypothetical protein
MGGYPSGDGPEECAAEPTLAIRADNGGNGPAAGLFQQDLCRRTVVVRCLDGQAGILR